MNIKNKKGVTLVALIITIIVMAILFSITYATSLKLLKNSQRKKMKTMLYMVKSRAEILFDDYLFENEGKDFGAIDDAEIEAALCGKRLGPTKIEKIQSVGYEEGQVAIPVKSQKIYCEWDEDVLKSQGIDTKNLAQGDTIIVQYNLITETVDVASVKGFSTNGIAIHALKDF